MSYLIGRDQDKADAVMDKLEDIKARTEDINDMITSGVDEELEGNDDILKELDASIDEDKLAGYALPDVPSTIPSGQVSAPSVPTHTPVASSAAEERDLEADLAAL